MFSKYIDVVVDLETLDSIEPLNHLPVSIQRDVRKMLKTIWFNESVPPEDPHRFLDYRYLDIYCLNRDEFLMLINHPSERSLEFLPSEMQTCHVSFDYFEFKIGCEKSYVLCDNCFKITCSAKEHYDDYDFEYLPFWLERNWKFFHVTKHFEFNVDLVLDNVIKQEPSWCDRCVLKPLFQLFDYSACKNSTHDHDYDNSSDSDVSSITSHNVFELYDPFHF